MKTFRAIIVVMGLAVFFANCKPNEEEPVPPPDTTPPEITVPDDTIRIGLGDRDAVLEGVTATDSGYIDLTSSIRITNEENLESIGSLIPINFAVSDAAGNTQTATRMVSINCSKLQGVYDMATSKAGGGVGDTLYGYTTTVSYNTNLPYQIQLKNFHNSPEFNAGMSPFPALRGDGPNRLKIVESSSAYPTSPGSSQVALFLTGTATFARVGSTAEYRIVSMNYKLTPENDNDPGAISEEFNAVCTKRP